MRGPPLFFILQKGDRRGKGGHTMGPEAACSLRAGPIGKKKKKKEELMGFVLPAFL